MVTAKIFENGRSQAVRLPKEYRFDDSEVYIQKVGDVVMLFSKSQKWKGFLQGLEMFSEDFMENGRSNQDNQEREVL